MSRLQALKAATTLGELAHLLHFQPQALSYVLYKLPPAAKYTTFQIPKRTGGVRVISAPTPHLKALQRSVTALLQDCWHEICLAKNRKDLLAHGFKRGRSIVTNARKHRNRKYVFNADLKDFFPSINFGRVRGYFIKDRDFSLHTRIATILAQIACHDNQLPQGSACSPVISNLIGHVLDIQLAAMAAAVGCTYSRYADDLTFSTNKVAFPSSVADQDPTSPHGWRVGKTLTKLILHNGFSVNPDKTRMQYHNSRQEVTGLVVNRRPNVKSEYRYLLRALVHNLHRKGAIELRDHNGTLQPASVDQLHGMLNFVDSVDLEHRFVEFVNGPERNSLKKSAKQLTAKSFGTMTSNDYIGPLTAGELLFQRFLLYKDFFAAQKPVIICEGDTDNVYLLHALHALAPSFPTLISAPRAGSSRLLVRLYKYAETRTGRILGLGDGGGTPLSTLLTTYLKAIQRFLAPIASHPFILLFDNDSGGNKVKGILKSLKVAIPARSNFAYVRANAYVMWTPSLAGKTNTSIEDFFDGRTKAIVLDGKTFDPSKKADPSRHYGKKVFAHRVVRPNAAVIDFADFMPLISSIVEIQRDYDSRRARGAVTIKP